MPVIDYRYTPIFWGVDYSAVGAKKIVPGILTSYHSLYGVESHFIRPGLILPESSLVTSMYKTKLNPVYPEHLGISMGWENGGLRVKIFLDRINCEGYRVGEFLVNEEGRFEIFYSRPETFFSGLVSNLASALSSPYGGSVVPGSDSPTHNCNDLRYFIDRYGLESLSAGDIARVFTYGGDGNRFVLAETLPIYSLDEEKCIYATEARRGYLYWADKNLYLGKLVWWGDSSYCLEENRSESSNPLLRGVVNDKKSLENLVIYLTNQPSYCSDWHSFIENYL